MGSGCSCTSDTHVQPLRDVHVDTEPAGRQAAGDVVAEPSNGLPPRPPSTRGNAPNVPQLKLFRDKISIPSTPVGKQKDVYKFYCPICFLWFKEMYRTECCEHYICEACAVEHVAQKLGKNKDEMGGVPQGPVAADCPHCNVSNVTFSAVTSSEDIRRYQESPVTKAAMRAMETRSVGGQSGSARSSKPFSPIRMDPLQSPPRRSSSADPSAKHRANRAAAANHPIRPYSRNRSSTPGLPPPHPSGSASGLHGDDVINADSSVTDSTLLVTDAAAGDARAVSSPTGSAHSSATEREPPSQLQADEEETKQRVDTDSVDAIAPQPVGGSGQSVPEEKGVSAAATGDNSVEQVQPIAAPADKGSSGTVDSVPLVATVPVAS